MKKKSFIFVLYYNISNIFSEIHTMSSENKMNIYCNYLFIAFIG